MPADSITHDERIIEGRRILVGEGTVATVCCFLVFTALIPDVGAGEGVARISSVEVRTTPIEAMQYVEGVG